MKKKVLLILSFVLLFALTALISTESSWQAEIADSKIYAVKLNNTDNGEVKEITNLAAYIQSLSEKYGYAELRKELNLLNVSEEEFYNPSLLDNGASAKITTTYISNESKTNAAYAASYSDNTVAGGSSTSLTTFNGIKFTVSVVGTKFEYNGVMRPIFRVTGVIEWINTAPSGYTDLIDIMCDTDMDPLNAYSGYENYNKMTLAITGQDPIDITNRLSSDLGKKSSTFAFESGSYSSVESLTVRREFQMKDSHGIEEGLPEYYAFTVAYAKATRSLSLSSLGFYIGISNSGVFPGVNFSFSYKNDFEIVSTSVGTWMVNQNLNIAEGAVYRIKCNKNIGLLIQTGLLNRWMKINNSSIDIGASITSTNVGGDLAHRFTFIQHIDATGISYEIVPYHLLGFRLSVESGAIAMMPANNSTSQRFRLINTSSGFKIMTYDNIYCLGLSGNGPSVQLESYSGATDQLWTFHYEYISNAPIENDSLLIRNKNSKLYFDIYGGSAYNGANLVQHQLNAGNNQQFKLVYAGNGDYTIQTMFLANANTYYCVKVDANGGNVDGANIAVYQATSENNEKFKIVRTSKDGYFKILTKFSGYSKCFSVANVSTENAANIHQWTFEETTSEVNRDNNLWSFV